MRRNVTRQKRQRQRQRRGAQGQTDLAHPTNREWAKPKISFCKQFHAYRSVRPLFQLQAHAATGRRFL